MRRLLIGITVLLLAGPTWAQTRDENLAACGGPDADARIVACTTLLQSGQESALLSSIYTDRGIAYGMKDLYDQAIADLSQAIGLVSQGGPPRLGDSRLPPGAPTRSKP
jgi:hypothetical protein